LLMNNTKYNQVINAINPAKPRPEQPRDGAMRIQNQGLSKEQLPATERCRPPTSQ
jgi:hypothetical protein